jgi:hypothetical protein
LQPSPAALCIASKLPALSHHWIAPTLLLLLLLLLLPQMIVEPELRVADFAKAGADIISVHCEGAATIHLHRTINQVRA